MYVPNILTSVNYCEDANFEMIFVESECVKRFLQMWTTSSGKIKIELFIKVFRINCM